MEHNDISRFDGTLKVNILENIISSEEVDKEELAAAINEEDDNYVADPELKPTSTGGISIYYNGGDTIDGLPNRQQFVDPLLRPNVENNDNLYFMPNDIEEINEYHYGVPKYVLRIYGILPSGDKAEVQITKIPVYFDTLAENAQELVSEYFDNIQEYDSPYRIENVRAFPCRGFNVRKRTFKRIFTENTKTRKALIEFFKDKGVETASNDRSSYYRKAARENDLPLSDWAVISNYRIEVNPKKSPLCKYLIIVDCDNYKPLINTMAAKAVREAAAKIKSDTPYLSKDKLLILGWDIETYSGRGLGDLPMPYYDEDECFMICLSFHWKDEVKPLCQICLVNVETAPDPNWITIHCSSNENLLSAFAICWREMAPDITVGFNDSDYDWKFVVEKADKMGILENMFSMMSARAPPSTRARKNENFSVMNWNYNKAKKIKISAEESFFSTFLKVPGCIPIDVRVCYKKLYPKTETVKSSSLKFYLDLSGLESKIDLPIKRMWQYYKDARSNPTEKTAEQMRHVSHYCIIDAVRCQQLMVRRNIVTDYREVSSLAFVSLYDSHYYAGGMKVCNLLGAYAHKRDILVSMIPKDHPETGKYPGAFVFPPEKGICPNPDRLMAIERLRESVSNESVSNKSLKNNTNLVHEVKEAINNFAHDRPVTGLDFSSLYPSLIMTYNLSPEKIILDYDEAQRWKSEGYKIHDIEFQFNDRQIKGWSIMHESKTENIGLYPSVLIDLFAKRAEVKKKLGQYGIVKELLELIFNKASKLNITNEAAHNIIIQEIKEEYEKCTNQINQSDISISPGSTIEEELSDLKRRKKNAEDQLSAIKPEENLKELYEKTCFEYTCANTKQNALKVYMNTFYGEAGNSLSPFFLLELAGGVTSSGQYNIKMVADFVRSKGFIIKYGDTDSLYLIAPQKYFQECDSDFIGGKLDREGWMSAMVRITMRALNNIRDEVNECLRLDNGSSYLKMAYEEVLYPVVFTGKKKYFGVPHLNEVNFHATKYFIKGIDVVKQGQSGMAKNIGNEIIAACMNIHNTRTVKQIVEDILTNSVVDVNQWKLEDFKKSDAYRPNKENVSVQRFVARMKIKHEMEIEEAKLLIAKGEKPKPYIYAAPEAGERFYYIIVKTDDTYNLRGCKVKPKKGDKMEYSNTVKLEQVDIGFYIVSYVIGLCARFINSEEEFQLSGCTDEKKIDEHAQKTAKKYLEQMVMRINGVNPALSRKRGCEYRSNYKTAFNAVRGKLVNIIGHNSMNILHGKWLNYEIFSNEENYDKYRICLDIVKSADDMAQSLVTTEWCETMVQKLYPTNDLLSGELFRNTRNIIIIESMHTNLLNKHERNLANSIQIYIPSVSQIAEKYQILLTRVVTDHRNGLFQELDCAHIMNEDDKKILDQFCEYWNKIVSIRKIKIMKDKFRSHLNLLKTKKMGIISRPSSLEVEEMINEDMARRYGV
jgi:DNA polymerase elongation subunit (family B)